MDNDRVLITGAGGQVGTALKHTAPGAKAFSHHDLDVTDARAVAEAAAGIDVIVHLAALTNVDGCEAEPDTAHRVNVGGTKNVVAAAREHGARVVFLSTDYVFSGEDAPYSEDGDPGPVNVYGETKLAGERLLDTERDLIVRASWIFGAGRNFVTTILRAATSGPVRVVDDQIGRPTSADALALALVDLIDRGVSGCVHVAGDGAPCSWADLAETAIAGSGLEAKVQRVSTEQYRSDADGTIARRPPNGTLGLDKARALGIPLVDWRTSLTAYLKGIP